MGKTIIITSGPTNERIDAVMKITNMSTGALGATITETMLGYNSSYASMIDKIYYLSTKLSRKPVVPDGQTHKLFLVQVESTDDLLDALGCLLRDPNEHIDAVVHSAAVGDYKAKYSVRGENLAEEIAAKIAEAMRDPDPMDENKLYNIAMDVLDAPDCVADDSTKMSSYEPHLMTMMALTPKVIGRIKEFSPDTMLIGFKLLENVPEQELFDVASRLRQKNKADYIVANDLSKIGGGKHPAMIIGYDNIAERDAVVTKCETKTEIAETISRLILGDNETYLFATKQTENNT